MRVTTPLVALALVLAMSAETRAYHLVENTDLRVDVIAWAQAGYQVVQAPGADLVHGPYIGFARLQGLVDHRRWGGAFVQFAADAGTPTLLDVIAFIRPIRELEIRFGKFRASTSMDVLIGAPFTPFVNRSQLVSMVPRRHLGVEALGHYDFGPVKATLQVGWLANGDIADPGFLLTSRLLLELKMGLSLHVAHAVEALAPRQGPAAARTNLLDVAVQYAANGLTVRAEGVAAFTRPEDSLPLGAYLEVLYAIPLPSDMALEPGVHYGLLHEGGLISQRGTLGLTWYIFGDHLNSSLNYEVLSRGKEIGHAAYLQIQGGY